MVHNNKYPIIPIDWTQCHYYIKLRESPSVPNHEHDSKNINVKWARITHLCEAGEWQRKGLWATSYHCRPKKINQIVLQPKPFYTWTIVLVITKCKRWVKIQDTPNSRTWIFIVIIRINKVEKDYMAEIIWRGEKKQ